MKTKKSFRKKALLSSVAMLLVAAVAVGSATFAWFTKSDSATADGIYVKTIRGSSIELSDSSKTWTSQLHYNAGSSGDSNFLKLLPASTIDGSTWVHAHSASQTVSAENLKGDIEKVANVDYYDKAHPTNTTHLFKQMLNVRNASSDDANAYENVNISLKSVNVIKSYGRIALVPCSAAGVNNYGGKTFKDFVFSSDGEETTGLGESGKDSAPYNPKNLSSSNVLYTIPKLGGTTDTFYFNLYIWFEGQDKQCVDAQVGQTIDNLEFDVAPAVTP